MTEPNKPMPSMRIVTPKPAKLAKSTKKQAAGKTTGKSTSMLITLVLVDVGLMLVVPLAFFVLSLLWPLLKGIRFGLRQIKKEQKVGKEV